jgi:hypothetical protein
VDVCETAREAGIRFPVFLTRTLLDACVTTPPGVHAQDESGRLWDVLWMTRVSAPLPPPQSVRSRNSLQSALHASGARCQGFPVSAGLLFGLREEVDVNFNSIRKQSP